MTILEALKMVSARDDDHARQWNHVGFSGQDTNFANKLAALDKLSPKQELYAAKFCRKYRKQVFAYALAAEQANPSALPNLYLMQGQNAKGKAKEASINAFIASLTWQHPTFDFSREAAPEAPKYRGKVSAFVGDKTNDLKGFVVRFPYDAELVQAVKNVPNRQFKNDPNDKRWVTGCTPTDIVVVAALVKNYNLEASEATRKFLGI